MEQLNKIELCGNVGNAYLTDFGDRQVLRFSLATNFAYRGRQGDVIETTWHNIVAWSGAKMPALDKICKGSRVHVLGRVRQDKYQDKDGNDVSTFIVAADRIEILQNEGSFASQM